MKGSARYMAKPHEVCTLKKAMYHAYNNSMKVFSSPDWAALGFMVVDPSIQGEALMRLRLQEHPPGSKLLNLLNSAPPATEQIATQYFTILASRVSCMPFSLFFTTTLFEAYTMIIAFSVTELQALYRTPFIPVPAKTPAGALRYLSPTQCYFKGESKAQVHSKLFTFVDFGMTANAFLSACGVKREPSVEEIVKILLENPRQFYELAEGREKYGDLPEVMGQ